MRSGDLTFDTFANTDFARVAAMVAYDLRQIGLPTTVQTFGARIEQQNCSIRRAVGHRHRNLVR